MTMFVDESVLKQLVDGSLSADDFKNNALQSYAASQQPANTSFPQMVQNSLANSDSELNDFFVSKSLFEPFEHFEYQINFVLRRCAASDIPNAATLLTILNATRSNNPTVQNLVEQLLLTCNLTQGEQQ